MALLNCGERRCPTDNNRRRSLYRQLSSLDAFKDANAKWIFEEHGETCFHFFRLHAAVPACLISSSLGKVTTAASGELNMGLSGTVMIV